MTAFLLRNSLLVALLSAASALHAQSTAVVRGDVVDSTGAAMAGAAIELANALTGFRQTAVSLDDGSFVLANIPFQSYVITARKDGFMEARSSLSLRTNIPSQVRLELFPASQMTRIAVNATDVSALVDPESTGTRVELNASAIERMPVAPTSRGLEAALLSFPGFAMNANGAIHPRGAHNQMTYVIDGMPISDQLTGAFANAVDPAVVQTVELFTGNIPPEYGNKVSGVAVITTRSGLGTGRDFSGSSQITAGEFDSFGQITQFAGGRERWGYFASVNTLKSNRYLDAVSLDDLHNGGNSERAFARVDYQLSASDQFRFHLLGGRSSFQLANLRSQHANGQDQRQMLRDFSASTGWLHTLGSTSTIDGMVSYRTVVAQLFGSPGDTPVTAEQARHLTTITASGRWNRQAGPHVLRIGADFQRFPISENFSFGITEPSFNAPGSASFIPTLLPFDLSRGGRSFDFSSRSAGTLFSLFGQDTVRLGRWVLALGLRYDRYRFLSGGNQIQPRVGLTYAIQPTGTVFRASYNRTFQTPPNENLLLSNSGQAGVLVPEGVRNQLGGTFLAIRSERQDVFEVGVQQRIGSHWSLNTVYYHKRSEDLQDNDNFFNTGIIFPISIAQSRTNGAELRLSMIPFRRLTGSLSLTHFHTVVTPPFSGGIFLGSTAIGLLNAGAFVIDHDQVLGAHGMLQYDVTPSLWISGAVRYDSGLVANPSDPAQVAADPDYADLLPYVNLDSDPARVNARAIVDAAVGYIWKRNERRAWEVTAQVSNLNGMTGLYNFQSIFVGTRLVQPRTFAAKLRWFF